MGYIYSVRCVPKKIPDIIGCNLKKDYRILIIFVRIFTTQLAIKRPFKFSPHPVCASALPGKNGTHNAGVKLNKKVRKNIPDIIDCNLKKDDRILI